jgi:hypothetical protein
MMGSRDRLTADEFDAFTRWRRLLHWRPGALKKVKRAFAKRSRKTAKAGLREHGEF